MRGGAVAVVVYYCSRVYSLSLHLSCCLSSCILDLRILLSLSPFLYHLSLSVSLSLDLSSVLLPPPVSLKCIRSSDGDSRREAFLCHCCHITVVPNAVRHSKLFGRTGVYEPKTVHQSGRGWETMETNGHGMVGGLFVGDVLMTASETDLFRAHLRK